ncbi:MAG: NAD-dependent epimerase/dehydratase family protein, partial [Opitutales bacterium]
MADGEKRVLVTGSNGCIGAATVKWLLANGADEVVGLNRREPDPAGDARHRELQCDVTDAKALQEILAEIRPSHVVHLAALQTPECRDHPMLGLEVNLVGTINLCKACASLEHPLHRFVFASSGGVFGPRSMYGKEGVQADDAYLPHSLYGYWKIAGEGIGRAFEQETGTPTVSLRLATTYGPGRDRGYTAAGTRAIKAIALGEPFVIPYTGSEHYHFVDDVGAGFGCATFQPFKGYGAFNLRGETRTIEQFLDMLRNTAEGFGVRDRFKVSISPDAEKTPFVYGLSSDTTMAAFPEMPLTDLG